MTTGKINQCGLQNGSSTKYTSFRSIGLVRYRSASPCSNNTQSQLLNASCHICNSTMFWTVHFNMYITSIHSVIGNSRDFVLLHPFSVRTLQSNTGHFPQFPVFILFPLHHFPSFLVLGTSRRPISPSLFLPSLKPELLRLYRFPVQVKTFSAPILYNVLRRFQS